MLITLNNNAFASNIQITDAIGNIVRLEKPAQRIIALAPHIVENVFTAGAGKQLVGAVEYSNYPQEALDLPLVGGYGTVNLETIVELQPDLILGWQSGNQNKIFDKIRNLGIPLYIDQPKSLQDVATVIKHIGLLSGQTSISERAAEQYLHKLKQLENQFRQANPIDVFYQVWDKPLYTVNGEHIISHVIELCGGNNIYKDESILSPVINLESLIELNPEVIMSGLGEKHPAWLDNWKKWPHLNAVKNNNLYSIHPDIIQRHTIRILEGAAIMCKHLETARKKLQ